MSLNTGKPWSDMDLADLANDLVLGISVEEIACFLCRDVGEVRDKIGELGRHPLPRETARIDPYL
jgi:hypothetical protein